MKTISHLGQITSISAKSDGSLGYRMTTQELSPEEKAVFFEMMNQNVDVTLKPFDEPSMGEVKVNGELNSKSPSQRLRGVYFVLWSKLKEQGAYVEPDFEDYWRKIMNELIDRVKLKIEEVE